MNDKSVFKGMGRVFMILQLLYLGTVSSLRDPIYLYGSSCIQYNSDEKAIELICGSMRLSDVDMELDNDEILEGHVEEEDEEENNSDDHKTWLLKANLIIGKDASFTIDPVDTKWLK